tara:strand:- start:15761 stop:16312 length:552 start_codon:yes stop_codon:yes gene_type:complete
MRAGRLNISSQLLAASGGIIGTQLIGITENDTDGNWQPGLIQRQNITVRARWNSAIQPGRLLKTADRVLLIGPVTDPDGRKQDLLISAQALTGSAAVIDPDGAAVTARCALLSYRAAPEGEHSYLGEARVRRQAEFCNAEYDPAVGAEFACAGSLYRITQIDPDESTAIITRVWIEFLQYTQG